MPAYNQRLKQIAQGYDGGIADFGIAPKIESVAEGEGMPVKKDFTGFEIKQAGIPPTIPFVETQQTIRRRDPTGNQ
jgi:hypothetical protein